MARSKLQRDVSARQLELATALVRKGHGEDRVDLAPADIVVADLAPDWILKR